MLSTRVLQNFQGFKKDFLLKIFINLIFALIKFPQKLLYYLFSLKKDRIPFTELVATSIFRAACQGVKNETVIMA